MTAPTANPEPAGSRLSVVKEIPEKRLRILLVDSDDGQSLALRRAFEACTVAQLKHAGDAGPPPRWWRASASIWSPSIRCCRAASRCSRRSRTNTAGPPPWSCSQDQSPSLHAPVGQMPDRRLAVQAGDAAPSSWSRRCCWPARREHAPPAPAEARAGDRRASRRCRDRLRRRAWPNIMPRATCCTS